MPTIAGHVFVQTPTGRECPCGRRWIDICGAGPDDVGKLHIAHVGVLYASELAEIEAEVRRIWDAVMEVCA